MKCEMKDVFWSKLKSVVDRDRDRRKSKLAGEEIVVSFFVWPGWRAVHRRTNEDDL